MITSKQTMISYINSRIETVKSILEKEYEPYFIGLFSSEIGILENIKTVILSCNDNALQCPGCNEIFFPSNTKSIYCSNTCRVRKHRQKKLQKKVFINTTGTDINCLIQKDESGTRHIDKFSLENLQYNLKLEKQMGNRKTVIKIIESAIQKKKEFKAICNS